MPSLFDEQNTKTKTDALCQHRTQMQVGLGPPTDRGHTPPCVSHPSKLLFSLREGTQWGLVP